MSAARIVGMVLAGLLALSMAPAAHAERETAPQGRETHLVAPKPVSAAERRKAEAAKAKAEARAKRPDAPQRKEAPPVQAVSEVLSKGNNGELRSGQGTQTVSLFGGLFGTVPASSLLPQTRALDTVLEERNRKGKFQVKADFEPQTVAFSGYPRGTIVINTGERFLYLVESPTSARRYAVAVGRDGLQFKGKVAVGDKQEWPRWIPTLDMQKREPKKYGQYKDGMPGGPDNPLGARAIYLYDGNKDTYLRIHGTNQPQTIGTNSSNGCFRMINEHVMDLYGRVSKGTQVVVL